MKKHRIESFTKGWFVGDFSPSLLPTKEFEAAVKIYKVGDKEGAHCHPIGREYTVVASGKFRMNDLILNAGDLVELSPGDVADFECLENGCTFVIKTPSLKNDKVMVTQ